MALLIARNRKADLATMALQSVRLGTDQETGIYRRFPLEWQLRYWNKLPAFVWDCFEWGQSERGPHDYQEETMADLMAHHRLSERGPRNLGKSAELAWFVLWFAMTRDGRDWKCPTTAGSTSQLKRYLWPEIHKWARRIRWDVVGAPPFRDTTELQTMALKLTTGQAFAVKSDNPGLMEGVHADHLAYVMDEAKVIPDDTWDAVEGAFAGGERGGREIFVLAFSTPGAPQGRLYEIHTQRRRFSAWQPVHITSSMAVASGQVDPEWINDKKKTWGETDPRYQQQVEGNFAASGEDAVIPLHWVELAQRRWENWHAQLEEIYERRDLSAGVLQEELARFMGPLEQIGGDVGAGGDLSTAALRFHGYVISEIRKWDKRDTMETVGRFRGLADRYTPGNWRSMLENTNKDERPILHLDTIGIGAGVGDRLKEMAYRVARFTASASNTDTDESGEYTFVDTRSAAWWHTRYLLNPANGYSVCLPPDDDLVSELTAPKWRIMSRAKIKVEEKAQVRQRLKRSTDVGDAVVQALYPPTQGVTGFPEELAEALLRPDSYLDEE